MFHVQMSMKSVALLTVLACTAHGYYLNPSIPEASQLPTSQDLPSTELPKATASPSQDLPSTELPKATTAASPSQQYQHNEPAAVAFWADRVKNSENRVEPTPSAKVS